MNRKHFIAAERMREEAPPAKTKAPPRKKGGRGVGVDATMKFRLSKELMKKFDLRCEEAGITRSDQIRTLIEGWVNVVD